MYESSYYSSPWHSRLLAESAAAEAFQEQRRVFDARSRALHVSQIKEVYHKSSKIADLVYIQGYGEFLLDKNDNLIKVQKEQDNEL